jgi:putative restriction endonuclease
MCGRLDYYLNAFSSLSTNKNRNHWPKTTKFQAPHKPFLLLSIFDLIASGTIVRNFIEPSFELAETFSGYWQRIMPIGSSGSMSYPFYFLYTSDFWHLVGQHGRPHRNGRKISSVSGLKKFYLGAKFKEDLYSLLVMESSREKLRETIIQKYFSPRVHGVLLEQAMINRDASNYSAILLQVAEKQSPYHPIQETKAETKKKVRDQGFRKAITQLYEHRCALCGIRMLTPEGRTIIEAAHIVPFRTSHDDKPQNGMALCRLCHWSFDEGLMSVGKEYEVLVSPAVRQNNNYPGHMETLTGRGIFKPQQSIFWPDQKNLDFHRETKFRKK